MRRFIDYFLLPLVAVLLFLLEVVSAGPASRASAAPSDPNQASRTTWTYQVFVDGGPYSYVDGGPSSYADGGPYQPLDAGYFCDGGTWFLNTSGCYALSYDGGPLALDAGPVSIDGGPTSYDAGVHYPFAILDAGATSDPFYLPQRTHLSWVGTVSTDGGQDAYGVLCFGVTNDGVTWQCLVGGFQLNQDGGASQSSINFVFDFVPMDYYGAEVVFLEDGGSNGVLRGNWYSKGNGQ